MIVPTAANGLKLLTFLAAISGQVYLVGSGETLTRLLAGLGLVGLAASLAAQDTLKNFFGTLLLIGEHPFRIGDYVADPGAGRGRRERRLPLDPPADAGGLAADHPELGDGVGPDRQPGRPDLPALPRARLAGLRHAPRAHGGPARRRLRAYAAAHPKVRADKMEVHIAALGESSVDLMVQVYFQVATLLRGDGLPRRAQPGDASAGGAARRGDRVPDQDGALRRQDVGGARGPAAAEAPGARPSRDLAARRAGTLPGDNPGERGGPDGS